LFPRCGAPGGPATPPGAFVYGTGAFSIISSKMPARRKRRPFDLKEDPWRARVVPVNAVPLTPGAREALEASLKTLHAGVRAIFPPGTDPHMPGRFRRLEGEFRVSSVPASLANARRAIDRLQHACGIEDIPLTVTRKEATLIGADLKIEGFGIFKLSRGLGRGLALFEAALSFNPLPPPEIDVALTIVPEGDLDREAKLSRL